MKTKTKILIVEDDLPLAMMMAFLLTRAGCDVLTANTGEKGMKMALEKKFDLITLDVDLPDINGFELCHELKQRHFSRQTPVVFVSGRPGEQDVQRGLETGAVDYITKPFDPQEFTSRLLSHVRLADEMAGPTLNFRGGA